MRARIALRRCRYRMTRKALAKLVTMGYDSVQFPRTEEHGILKFEIIDLRPHRFETPPTLSLVAASPHRHLVSVLRS